MSGALVLDFEGTVTEGNFLPSIVREFAGPRDMQPLNQALRSGSLTLQELLEQEFARISAPLADVVEWTLTNVRVRPGLRQLVDASRNLGLQLVVVSGAFFELINPVLAREGLRLAVRAPHVEARSEGWRVLWPAVELCSECGERCKRMLLPTMQPSIYVGDGRSDRCAALAVDSVFARDELASHLDSLRVPYIHFGDLRDVARALPMAITRANARSGPPPADRADQGS